MDKIERKAYSKKLLEPKTEKINLKMKELVKVVPGNTLKISAEFLTLQDSQPEAKRLTHLKQEIEYVDEYIDPDKKIEGSYYSLPVKNCIRYESDRLKSLQGLLLQGISEKELNENDELGKQLKEYQTLSNYLSWLKSLRERKKSEATPITKSGFSMKEETEKIWKMINDFINIEWAEGDVFFDDDYVNWKEDGGKYTLVEFVDRITKHDPIDKDAKNLIKHPLVTGARDWRKDFIMEFFTIKGKRITRDQLKDPRKNSRKKSDGSGTDFSEYLDKLIIELNRPPYNCKYYVTDGA